MGEGARGCLSLTLFNNALIEGSNDTKAKNK